MNLEKYEGHMKNGKGYENTFHLLIEFFDHPNSICNSHFESTPGPSGLENIEIPTRGTMLIADSRRLSFLTDNRDADMDRQFGVQPLWEKPDPCLLMVCPGRSRALINGLPAPPVALLHIKDEILFSRHCGYVAHVSLYIRPHVGSPPANRVGKKCPICRSEFKKNSNTYTCHVCSQVLHCEGPEMSKGDGLDCAGISRQCPTCEQPIYRAPGYFYLPDFLKDTFDGYRQGNSTFK